MPSVAINPIMTHLKIMSPYFHLSIPNFLSSIFQPSQSWSSHPSPSNRLTLKYRPVYSFMVHIHCMSYQVQSFNFNICYNIQFFVYTQFFNDSCILEQVSSRVQICLPPCVLAFDKYVASGCKFQVNDHCESD